MARFPHLSLHDNPEDSPRFCLTSDDFDEYAAVFESCGLDGGGYDWQAVAERLMQSEAKRQAKQVSFDSEASMFCAWSDRKAALEKLQALLCHTFRSKARLRAAICLSAFAEDSEPTTKTAQRFVLMILFRRYIYDEPLVKLLEESLPQEHQLVYHPRGAGEDVFYFRTDHVDDAVASIKPLLRKVGLLKEAVIGWAPRDQDEYAVLYPRPRKTPVRPRLELCPTIS